MIDRMQLIKEEILRDYIRKQLRNQDKLVEQKENTLRNVIRQMLDEGVDKEGTTENTGINALERLLSGNVLTIFKDTYKELTTDPAQRVSYIKHILSFIDDTLKPDQINDEAAEEASPETGTEDLEEINVKIGDDETDELNLDDEALFPDIDKDEKEKEEEGDEYFLTSLEGLDQTGREFAIKAFEGGMNTQITKAYSMLRGKDAELFKKYLLKNLDLHRMQAEKELPEPNDDLANKPAEELK
jgi:hypothetical protein